MPLGVGKKQQSSALCQKCVFLATPHIAIPCIEIPSQYSTAI